MNARFGDHDRICAHPAAIAPTVIAIECAPRCRRPQHRAACGDHRVPGTAPGGTGILNALSPKYCDWTGLVDVEPEPPILWTHGAGDLVVADGSALEMGTLGAAGAIPGWPGADVYPPQPMVSQIAAMLERYEQAGGRVRTSIFAGAGHGPHFDARERWLAEFPAFLADA